MSAAPRAGGWPSLPALRAGVAGHLLALWAAVSEAAAATCWVLLIAWLFAAGVPPAAPAADWLQRLLAELTAGTSGRGATLLWGLGVVATLSTLAAHGLLAARLHAAAGQMADRLRRDLLAAALTREAPLRPAAAAAPDMLFEQPVRDWVEGQRTSTRAVALAAGIAPVSVAVLLSLHPWLTVAGALLAALIVWLDNGWQQRWRQQMAVLEDRSAWTHAEVQGHVRAIGPARLAGTVEFLAAEAQQRLAQLSQLHAQQVRARLRRGALTASIGLAAAAFWLLLAAIAQLQNPPQWSTAAMLLSVVLGSRLGWVLWRWGATARHDRARETARRHLCAYLALPPQPPANAATELVPRPRESIGFERVTLSDGAERLLDDVSFQVAAGQRVALAADRRTLLAIAQLLRRLSDPDSGSVLWDERDLRDADPGSLRRQVMLLDGTTPPAAATVLEYLQGEGRATRSEAEDALRQTGMLTRVQRWPLGLLTPMAETADMTCDERFRLAAARALLADPAVVLIDEPDIPPQAHWLLDDVLSRLAAGRTLLVLPSRPVTLRAAQRVLVLRRGRFLAAGRHMDLLNQCEYYRHWNYLRFNEFREAPSARS